VADGQRTCLIDWMRTFGLSSPTPMWVGSAFFVCSLHTRVARQSTQHGMQMVCKWRACAWTTGADLCVIGICCAQDLASSGG
jgi:hypothetical protein